MKFVQAAFRAAVIFLVAYMLYDAGRVEIVQGCVKEKQFVFDGKLYLCERLEENSAVIRKPATPKLKL